MTRFLGVILDPYELFVALLPIRPKDLAEDEQTELIGIAVHFVCELFQQGRGEGTFNVEKEGPIFFGEQIIESWAVKAKSNFLGGQWAFEDREQAGAFSVQGDGDELAVRESFEDAFEGGAGDMRRVGEVVVAHSTCAFTSAQMPKPQVDGLFRGVR